MQALVVFIFSLALVMIIFVLGHPRFEYLVPSKTSTPLYLVCVNLTHCIDLQTFSLLLLMLIFVLGHPRFESLVPSKTSNLLYLVFVNLFD